MHNSYWIANDDPALLAECAAELFMINVYRAPTPPHCPDTWLLDLESSGVAVVVPTASVPENYVGHVEKNAVTLELQTERNSLQLFSMAQELGWQARSAFVEGKRCIRIHASETLVFEVAPTDRFF